MKLLSKGKLFVMLVLAAGIISLLFVMGFVGCESPITQSQNQVITQNPGNCIPQPVPDCSAGVVNFTCEKEILFSQPATCKDCPELEGCPPTLE